MPTNFTFTHHSLQSVFLQITPFTPFKFNPFAGLAEGFASRFPVPEAVLELLTVVDPPPVYTLVCPPPDYSPYNPYIYTEFFHTLFFYPFDHPLLFPTPSTISPSISDTSLRISIAFLPEYGPRTHPAPQPPSTVTPPSLDTICRRNAHRRCSLHRHRTFGHAESAQHVGRRHRVTQ